MSAYDDARKLANDVRSEYGFTGARVLKTHLRRVYKALGIRIDYRDYKFKNLRGAYFPEEPYGPSVMIAKALPEEPQIFTLAHELKHHLTDRDRRISFCDPSNEDALVEKAAEVFAAELIFPLELFVAHMERAKIELGQLAAEHLVHLKVESQTTMSYAALCKTAEHLGYCPKGAFAGVQFRKLQEALYGVPFYRRNVRRRGAG